MKCHRPCAALSDGAAVPVFVGPKVDFFFLPKALRGTRAIVCVQRVGGLTGNLIARDLRKPFLPEPPACWIEIRYSFHDAILGPGARAE